MVQIKVTPDQVRQVAQKFRSESSNSQSMVNTLKSTVDNLSQNWEGMTRQRFWDDFQNWQKSMQSFVQLLDDIAKQLDAIANRFEQADKA